MPRAALVGVPVLLVALVIAILAGIHAATSSSSGPSPTPTIDPRLVVRPHRMPLSGTLGGAALHGSLYPAVPGLNTVSMQPALKSAIAGSYLDLTITMPGMHMFPIKVRLRPVHGSFSGGVLLPMFGNYTASLTLVTGNQRQSGTANLSLPLTIGQ